jgi:CMP-N,N'-diacetyllegionaminic acid synthase
MNILGVIPARAGSKGIKNKNIYPICGKPLIEWTIEEIMCSSLDNYVVTTDDRRTFITYTNALLRPSHLARDDSHIIDELRRILYRPVCREVDAIMLLQPTSPLRTAEDIDNCIKLFKESDANSLYSGYYIGIKHKDSVYDKHTSPKHFQRNGAIFITKRELIEQGKLWDDTVIEYEMPLSRSIDIDTMDDMMIAEALLKHRNRSDNI